MEYTKGEWKLDRCSMAEATIETGDMLIQIYFHRMLPLAVCEANARLIAAAPDMYEACKEALEVVCYWLDGEAVQRDNINYRAIALDLRKAINKAEGKEIK